MSPARVPLIYGAAPFGIAERAWRISDPKIAQEIVDVFSDKYGYKELDTSRAYSAGTSEKMLSLLNLHGAHIDTKIYPVNPGDHSPEKLTAALRESITALGPKLKIRTLYLHAPDRDTPYEVTLEAVNKLYKEGLFESFGLSNFWSWEVAQIYSICKERNYVLPTVYQGAYSIIARTNEIELFPALRQFNIRFMAYSPLAGGLLKGDPKRPGGRYDPNAAFGTFQLELYTAGRQYEALELIKTAGDKHGISLGEIALRWIQHHSQLTPKDGVVFGGSSVAQVEENVVHSEGGALPQDVVDAAEQAWFIIRGQAVPYADGIPARSKK